ncbi:nucleotidyltransferase [Peribacillus sp. SCS-37]|uniref:nucleotidyltransferase n=1 Tax=Paraperibacillus esterisolvens TaxID=3115296 RepID=UPI003905AE1D
MEALGIIVEYNPFHNGHAYHIKESLKSTGADLVAAVMSGNFLQRGEPAMAGKWARARMALLGGADLVFELPYPFAAQQANIFARGSVGILEAAGCSHVCFGSESGSINAFLEAEAFLRRNGPAYDQSVKEFSKSGFSYPRAASLAFEALSGSGSILDLSKPNNILGLQYVRAIKDQSCSIKPCTIKRIGSGYHDESLPAHSLASATGIRKAIFEDGASPEAVMGQIPLSTYEELTSYHAQFGTFHNWELYWPFLQYRIISSSTSDLNLIYEAEEGLEYRFKEMAAAARTFQEFISLVKTKRYTWTRLQRAALNILNNVTKEEMGAAGTEPGYLRLLGMNRKGRQYLNENKKKLGLPLITRPSAFKKELSLDLRTSSIYALPLEPGRRKDALKREYMPPVFLDGE